MDNLQLSPTNEKLLDDRLEKPTFHIIGGGPVGFSIALLLAKAGYKSEVYESRNEILNDYEQSYPIGINSRTLFTLNEIDPNLEKEAIDSSIPINAWEIYSGSTRVALQESGVVYGTSRAKVNLLLYEKARKNNLIKINFNHKLIDLDPNKKILTFEVRKNNEKKSVCIFAEKVISSDGVNSKVRTFLEENDKNFQCEIIPWNNEYRVIFAKPEKTLDGLDPMVHYIVNSTYCAVILNENTRIWSLTLSLNHNEDNEEYKELFHSNDDSNENIISLKNIIQQKMPMFYPLIENDEEELRKFFKRRSYRGAVVKCSSLNSGEWIVLLGDSAHSVLPPTGEGINSGLEDTLILYNCLIKSGIENLFSNYTATRLPDIHGLFEYAEYLNESPNFPGEGASRLMFMIFSSCFQRRIFDELFGRESVKRLPYSDITTSWSRKKCCLLNMSRIICYPFALLFFVLTPWRWGICCKKRASNVLLKPPIN